MAPGALHRAAGERWPELTISEERFTRAWSERAARAPIDPALAPDVLLAAAIEDRQAPALRWLTEETRRAARSLGPRVPEHVLADVESEVLTLVAVDAPGHEGRIRRYEARGPLGGWLRVIVARVARARTGRQPAVAFEDALVQGTGAQGTAPELLVLRAQFSADLGPALHAASQRLSPRARTLLRLHYLDGVGLDELARAYQVHRVTISRWLADARAGFFEGTRDALAGRASLGRLEADSLVRALQSQFDLSLRRLLESRGP
jgi:RNA polymerase sigma-70 factor (ECF subfamily)